MSTSKEFLREAYLERRKKNGSYSLRAFAKNLGITPGALSRVMNGKLDLSVDRAAEFCNRLGLNETESKRLITLIQLEHAKNPDVKERLLRELDDESRSSNGAQHQQLTLDQFKIISDWYPFAILRLIQKGFGHLPAKEVSTILGITASEVQNSWDRLERLELIEKNKDIWIASTENAHIQANQSRDATRKYYLALIAKIQAHLEDASVDLQKKNPRASDAAVLTFQESQMPEVQKIMTEYHARLSKLSSSSKTAEHLYQAYAIVFPLSKKPLKEFSKRSTK